MPPTAQRSRAAPKVSGYHARARRPGPILRRMQTFLPYADFRRSAEALDDRRLGKQRVEAYQVMRALAIPSYGWRYHPVVAMWRHYPLALAAYGREVCRAWRERGFADTCEGKILATLAQVQAIPDRLRQRLAGGAVDVIDWVAPHWLGDAAFHASHRAMLLRKDPGWYARYGWTDAQTEYVWPEALPPRVPARTVVAAALHG
jgi:hypothetical protein